MRRVGLFFLLGFVLINSQPLFSQVPPPPPPPPMPTYPLTAWKEFDFADAWFRVSFPIKPKESTKTESVNGISIETKMYEVHTGDGSYTVSYLKLPQKREETEEQLKQRLRDMLKRLEQGQQYKWLGGKEIEIAGYPGIEFKYQLLGGQATVWQRFYTINDRLYRIISDTHRREPPLKEPQLFHDSFQFTPPPPPPPAKSSSISPVPKFMRVSSGVLQENAIKKVEPDFSKRQEYLQGSVQVAITVSENGKVEKAEVISGHPLLHEPVLQAARQWEFKPTLIGDHPVKLMGILTFNFKR